MPTNEFLASWFEEKNMNSKTPMINKMLPKLQSFEVSVLTDNPYNKKHFIYADDLEAALQKWHDGLITVYGISTSRENEYKWINELDIHKYNQIANVSVKLAFIEPIVKESAESLLQKAVNNYFNAPTKTGETLSYIMHEARKYLEGK